MRIAISFPACNRRGGVERVMLECANFLATRGHEVHAFSTEWDTEALSRAVHRHQVDVAAPVAALRPPAYLRASGRAIRAMNPPSVAIASFGVAAPPDSVVWMQSVHAAWIDVSRQTRGLGGRLRQRANPFHPVVLRMERRLLHDRRYRKVIALTDEVKRDVERFYDVPDTDIEVLPNGYSASEFHPSTRQRRMQIRAALGYEDDVKVVVFVANELERKGFEPLLRAVAALEDPSVRVLAVGRFSERDARARAARVGLDACVDIPGPTSNIADYYAAADVFALPTKYEAWGLVVVEAIASGLPVLTSRLAGASVAVQQGVNGLLLDDPASHEEIAAKLHRLLDGEHASPVAVSTSVERYEWSRLLLDYERILLESLR